MKNTAAAILIGLSVLTFSSSLCAENLTVLPAEMDGGAPRDMMKRYLLNRAEQLRLQWQEEYNQRTTPEQIAEYQSRLKAKFTEALGGFPKRTPLNARITGTVKRDGYIVEKIIFESQPAHYVTAALFVPQPGRFAKPYPGVLFPCGHSRGGKNEAFYQRGAALLALNGMAALVFDPIDQGERSQLLDENGNAPIWGTRSHTMLGVGSILLGQNTARFEIWDGMRALDYLQSRPEVDADKIGCTGNSGGGTQTSYFMALDDRIVAAAPSCYITSFDRILNTIGCQDAEQNIFGQLAFGMDHADYIMMRAPKPTLICCATNDFFDISGTWDTFRYAKRLYSRMGFAERVDIVETDNKHGFSGELRQGAVRWMARWLLNSDKPITEPENLQILTNEEILCTPKGQVMLLEGARSVYDLNIEYENQLAKQRKQVWSEPQKNGVLEKVRTVAGIRKLALLPKPRIEKTDTLEREDYTIEKLIFVPEEGIYLPALRFAPNNKPAGTVVLYLHEDGKAIDAAPGGPIEQLVKSGRTVFAVDIRGTGETKQTSQRYGAPFFGTDGQDVYAAYVMGRSYVAMRAEDILICARYAIGSSEPAQEQGIELIAVGNVGVAALHAAALEPKLFKTVTLSKTLWAWSNIIGAKMSDNQLINTVHGALTSYDLGDLAGLLGDRITICDPVDAAGKPIQN